MTSPTPCPTLRLTLRIDAEDGKWLGAGKVRLLELIARHGSISAASREMGMSYKRAWLLVEEVGRTLGRPVVTARPGGASGGGAILTEAGRTLVEGYRQLEADAQAVAAATLARLASLVVR